MNDLKNYFNEKNGVGVFSTANAQGEVNGAVYARPHIIDNETVAFIMCDRLSHQNLQSNSSAHYLFIEEGEGYHGIRLSLTMLSESLDQALIRSLSRRHTTSIDEKDPRILVTFKVTKSLKLIGGEDK
jgi:hypothetical protein